MTRRSRTGPVLAVFATPTTPRSAPAATLAKWAAAGREVHLLVLTNGDRGSSDPWRDRAELARDARGARPRPPARSSGSRASQILDVHDGELREHDRRSARHVVRRDPEVRADDGRLVRPDGVVLREPLLQPLGPSDAPARSRSTRCSPGAGNPHFFAEHLAEGLDVQPGARRVARLDERAEPPRGRDRASSRPKIAALAATRARSRTASASSRRAREGGATRPARAIGVEHAEDVPASSTCPRLRLRPDREQHLAEVVHGVGEALAERPRGRARGTTSHAASPSIVADEPRRSPTCSSPSTYSSQRVAGTGTGAPRSGRGGARRPSGPPRAPRRVAEPVAPGAALVDRRLRAPRVGRPRHRPARARSASRSSSAVGPRVSAERARPAGAPGACRTAPSGTS